MDDKTVIFEVEIMPTRELRRFPRIASTASVKVRYNQMPTDVLLENISAGGLCFRCECDVPTGDNLELELIFHEFNVSLFCKGDVVWRMSETGEQVVGVRFSGMEAQEKKLLMRYLGTLDPIYRDSH